jgi:hypothetical protein
MATRYNQVVNSLPASGFVRPTNAPTPRPMVSPGMGAGSPRTIASMDPRSLVPINRSQPVATDGGEARRLMENRSGMQPPSSFSGAGQAYTSGFAEPTMTTAVMPQTFTDPGPVADPDVMYMTGGGGEMGYTGRQDHVGRGINRPVGDGPRNGGLGPGFGAGPPVSPASRMAATLDSLEGRIAPEAMARLRANMENRETAFSAYMDMRRGTEERVDTLQPGRVNTGYDFRRPEKMPVRQQPVMVGREAYDAINQWRAANPGVPLSQLPPELAALLPNPNQNMLTGLLGG